MVLIISVVSRIQTTVTKSLDQTNATILELKTDLIKESSKTDSLQQVKPIMNF